MPASQAHLYAPSDKIMICGEELSMSPRPITENEGVLRANILLAGTESGKASSKSDEHQMDAISNGIDFLGDWLLR
ncbi:MAG TPA: hypothetical protein VHE33_02525 [Acidobacteriaceae bacterium]|nr:hypothetical protein [Acidobacteriaceae bacterium]